MGQSRPSGASVDVRRYFLFPETKGIPVETTHAVFKDHPIWTRLYPEIREVHAVDLPPPTDAPIPIPIANQKGEVNA